MLRLADAIGRGHLDKTMDIYMLVSLAYNAPLPASSTARKFGDQLLRFWTYVFGQSYSAKGAHRALTAGHCEAWDGGRPPMNMLNCPSPDRIKKFGRTLDGPDDVSAGGIYPNIIKIGVRRFLLRQIQIEQHLTREGAVDVVQRAVANGVLEHVRAVAAHALVGRDRNDGKNRLSRRQDRRACQPAESPGRCRQGAGGL